jgi:hypothetical protein
MLPLSLELKCVNWEVVRHTQDRKNEIKAQPGRTGTESRKIHVLARGKQKCESLTINELGECDRSTIYFEVLYQDLPKL